MSDCAQSQMDDVFSKIPTPEDLACGLYNYGGA